MKKNLRFFLNSLNEFDPCIMFTYESNKESIALPDIRVSLRNGKVFTDLYFKPTDRHQYLHYLSLFFFLLSGFSFTTIHDSRDSRVSI